MPNNLPAQQNSAEFIDLLRASQQIYSDAKWIGTAQLVLTRIPPAGRSVLIVPQNLV